MRSQGYSKIPVSNDLFSIPLYVPTSGITDNFVKTNGGDSWATGIYGTAKAVADFELTFKLGQVSMGGCASTFGTTSYWAMDNAIYVYDSAAANVNIYEAGTSKGTFAIAGLTRATLPNYTFRVSRVANVVRYSWSNNAGASWTVFYTSTVSSSATMYLSGSLYSKNYQNTFGPSSISNILTQGFVADSSKYRRTIFGNGQTVFVKIDPAPAVITVALPTIATIL